MIFDLTPRRLNRLLGGFLLFDATASVVFAEPPANDAKAIKFDIREFFPTQSYQISVSLRQLEAAPQNTEL